MPEDLAEVDTTAEAAKGATVTVEDAVGEEEALAIDWTTGR